ncbi:8123_t:CDS:2 [Entrophospora sp. SA101]|nr:8123_t:CDS:2 [Entrophospora sp. SA101]
MSVVVRELESGGLKNNNLESWYNCHVWSPIVDQGFGNIKGVSVVRGESASIATSVAKNTGRSSTAERKKMGDHGDWILQTTGKGDLEEFGAGEAGHMWFDEYGSKFLFESKLKLPKILKNMLVKLMKKANWNKSQTKQMQTIGIIHAGLLMMVLYIDNPNGYICRLNQSEMMEILDNEDLSSVLLVLAAVLNLKSSVEETIKAAQNKTKPTFEKAGMPRQSFDAR